MYVFFIATLLSALIVGCAWWVAVTNPSTDPFGPRTWFVIGVAWIPHWYLLTSGHGPVPSSTRLEQSALALFIGMAVVATWLAYRDFDAG